MSGHSKWATTKRAKAVVDAKRGAIFTKIANVITIAAREKGGDPSTNFSLRMAMDKARAANMPKDNVDRAIKRGTGEGGGAAVEDFIYEGIGPAKAQFVIKCLSDNKNRTASNIRHIFNKAGGALGAVMWNFDMKGTIGISNQELGIRKQEIGDWDEFELELVDNGAEDVIREDEGVTIQTRPEDLQKVKVFLESKNIATEIAEIGYVAKETAEVAENDRESLEKFVDMLEENEDVADYYTNVNI